MSTVIDFHSHILPGIDDGSKTVEQSIAMLKMEAEQGVSKVIATPHFYAQYDKPDLFLQRRAESEKSLRQEMAQHNDLPKLEIGAEVYYFSGISDCDALSALTIGEKRYILIEMPMVVWPERVYKELENIWIKQDLIPIVAHIERYLRPFRAREILRKLEDLPVLVQASAEFFLEKNTKYAAMRMLKQGSIHLLGSDCHNLTDRKPNLGEAVKAIRQQLGSEFIGHINRYEDEILGSLE